MARKDFAQSGGRKAPPKPPKSGTGQVRNMLLVVGILMVVAGSFAGGFWLGRGQSGMQGVQGGISREAKDQLLAQIQDQQRELTALKGELKKKEAEPKKPAATEEVGDLTFYNSLPKQAVAPAPMSRSPTAPKQQFAEGGAGEKPAVSDTAGHATNLPAIAPQGGFRVQVGSYQKQSDADGLVARLQKNGIAGRVEETKVAELGVWFRVYLGPYASRAEADAATRIVQQRMHITGLLLRGK